MKRGKAYLKQFEYINDSIETKCDSKIFKFTSDTKYYFKNRNIGLAGIGPSEVQSLCLYSLRQLRIWNEIKLRTEIYNKEYED